MLQPVQLKDGLIMSGEVKPNVFITRLARGVSHVTAPPVLTIPALIFLETTFNPHPSLANLAIALFFACIAPLLMIIVLRSLKLVSDVHIMDRTQRTLPYSIAILSFGLGMLTLWLRSGWGLLPALLACYLTTTLIVLVINLRWKISAHATGVSGTVAAFMMLAGWRALPLLLLLGLVCWARIYLRAHTPAQVLWGSLLGFSFTLMLLVVSVGAI